MASSILTRGLEHIDFSDVVDPSAPALEPTHPGDILREEFLEPLELSANALARELRVPANRISGIVSCNRAVTADTALRLARFFGGSAQFWTNLQAQYDIELARRALSGELERIERHVEHG